MAAVLVVVAAESAGNQLIPLIVPITRRRAFEQYSVAANIHWASTPEIEHTSAIKVLIITIVRRGAASRFVMRKYFGKVPKQYRDRGVVIVWQHIARLALSHIFAPMPFGSPLYHARMCGHRKTIPAIAR